MKLRALAALACAMILSLSAAGMVFATEPTATPSDEWTASPSDEATATPSDEWTASPTDEETSTPSDGEVEAATGTPTVTLPPTDGLSGGAGTGSGGVPIALLAMAGLIAAALFMTPAAVGFKRGKRRP